MLRQALHHRSLLLLRPKARCAISTRTRLYSSRSSGPQVTPTAQTGDAEESASNGQEYQDFRPPWLYSGVSWAQWTVVPGALFLLVTRNLT